MDAIDSLFKDAAKAINDQLIRDGLEGLELSDIIRDTFAPLRAVVEAAERASRSPFFSKHTKTKCAAGPENQTTCSICELRDALRALYVEEGSADANQARNKA